MLENTKRRYIILFVAAIFIVCSRDCVAQNILSGKVVDVRTGKPIVGATISLPEKDLWATADKSGKFEMTNIPSDTISVKISSLDYAGVIFRLQVNRDVLDTVFYLQPDDLSLENVTVTAAIKKDLATTYTIDRKALDQLQMLSVADATSLLPGRKTNTSLNLTLGAQNFAVNGFEGESGNPVFGVGVEVDGVRLSNNALPATTGVDVRNITTTNVESIEVVTGVASVEYGDMTNGLVKINTRKGASPYIIDMATKPNSKQVALSKGFIVGRKGSVLNLNAEHTKSVANIASPYTSYDRNGLSLNYSTTVNKRGTKPLFLNLGLSGSMGGSDSKSDPDRFTNTYAKAKDNIIRSNISGRWLLRKKWVTNLEFAAGINYNNKQAEESSNKSSSSSVVAIHTTEEGYHVGQTYEQNPSPHILLIAPGYWYEVKHTDSRALNYSASLKANWTKKWGHIFNNLKAGINYDGSQNLGRGIYFKEPSRTPTWREYRYDQESAINNWGAYLEDQFKVHTGGKSYFQVTGGLRYDITAIKGSEYGVVNSLSPRVNANYTFWENDREKRVTDFSIRAGWGKSVKMPSFNTLYKVLQYNDYLAFVSTASSVGEAFYAYYTQPNTRLYNPDLKWQSNIQKEVAINLKISGTGITLILSEWSTHNAFGSQNLYIPFTYKFTDQTNLENSTIPLANRIYSIDQTTGIVSITDKTGTRPTETLDYRTYSRFYSTVKPINNNSPLNRTNLSWIVDFKQIRSLRTSFRLDGSYYAYKYVDERISAYSSSTTMADNSPYKYIAYSVGGGAPANGQKTRSLNMNFTAITHVPAIRMVLSARIETSLYQFDKNISERPGGNRSFTLDDRNSLIPSQIQNDIYNSDRFVGMYPDYYMSLDDLNTPIPFKEKFLWAKDNDPFLYNELAKLVTKTNTSYYFNSNATSAYYSANFSVTKEIGNTASISFNATNFLNNMSLVRSSASDTELPLYDGASGRIPRFYYGISLRLKFK